MSGCDFPRRESVVDGGPRTQFASILDGQPTTKVARHTVPPPPANFEVRDGDDDGDGDEAEGDHRPTVVPNGSEVADRTFPGGFVAKRVDAVLAAAGTGLPQDGRVRAPGVLEPEDGDIGPQDGRKAAEAGKPPGPILLSNKL